MSKSKDQSPEQLMRKALDSAFAQFPDNSATLEALLPYVSRLVGRPVTPRQLELLMNKYPALFRQNNAGRWSLVQAAQRNREDTQAEPEPSSGRRPGLAATLSPLRLGSFVVFDLETMGTWNGPHQPSDIEILQVAAQRYRRYQPVGEPFVRFVRPSRPIPATITHLTRIGMNDVADASELKEVLDEFFEYTASLPLIAHNGALFDGPVLQCVAQRKGYALPLQLLILDTLPLARALLHLSIPGPIDGAPLENHRLGTLARFYGCEEEGAHRADVDVLMLGGVIRGLLGELGCALDGSSYPLHVNPAAPFILDLLSRAADPWAAFLDADVTAERRESLELAELFAIFGSSATPLVHQGREVEGTGPTTQAVEKILEAYELHGRERREPQARLAHLAGQAMGEKRFAVIEAGTGTGKGLGYLAPAYLQARATGSPVVVSTFTRVLQDQLYSSDLRFLSEVTGGQLTRALLKGRRNYLSSRCLAEELQDAFDEPRIEPGRAWTLITLISFAIASSDGDLSLAQGAFSGLEHLLATHQYTYMLLDQNQQPLPQTTHGSEVWNLLERVRVTAEVPRAAWPSGLPRPGERLDFAQRAQENARRADIIVVNHSLLLLKALRESESAEQVASATGKAAASEDLAGLLSPYLICDEAHTLEEAATSVLTRSVDLKRLRRLLVALIGVWGVQGGAYGGLVKACRGLGLAGDDPTVKRLCQLSADLLSQLEVIGQHLRRYIEHHTVVNREDRARYGVSVQLTRQSLTAAGGPVLRQGGQQLVELLGGLQEALGDLAVPIARQGQSSESLTARWVARAERMRLAIGDELRELAQNARWFWGFFEDNTTVRVVKFDPGGPEEATWSLSGMPVAVGALLHTHLWSRLDAAVVTSATLTSWGEGFDFFLNRVGLSRLPVAKLITGVLPHVFDYRSRALFLMPNHLPTPRDIALRKAYPEAVATELRRFIPFFGGRTLVLFTARSRMEQVHESVVGELEQAGFPILVQDEADALDRFKAEERVSLLGVRSLWEGVDVPGPSLSYVLIEKFPFPSLGDPLEAARMAAIERAGGDSFYEYMLPRASFQFKQGFGRLIRRSGDHGAVVMLDKRLRNAMYRGEVLASLPNPTIGYESDVEMYRRIAEWMGYEFDPDLLPRVPQNRLLEVLEQNRLPSNVVDEAEWVTVARPRIEQVLKCIWGDRQLHSFQEEALRGVLAGRDVLTLAPTGSGKSLTYQLPALLRKGCTLVISPLVALIRDQVTSLREQFGLTMVNSLVSGMSSAEQEEVLVDARAGRVRLLYVAPERLRDPRFRATMAYLPLVQLVVDEAHCISTWGHDFRPDFLEIVNLLSAAGMDHVPTHALTATATPQVQEEIITALKFPLWEEAGRLAPLIHASTYTRSNLVYRLYHCNNAIEAEERTVEIVRQISGNRERGGPGIVYAATRAKTERLAERLRVNNISAYAYHGGLPTAERHNIQQLFMDGEIEVVCCTNAFGMGVDKQNIRFVIHYDHPSSIEAYAQETGRAGRDGEEAYVVLLYSSATQRTHRLIARKGVQNSEEASALLDTLADTQVAIPLANGYILTSFENLAKALSMEEVAVRVLLHAAEQTELLQRGADVVMEAGILISRDIPELVARLTDARAQATCAKLLYHLIARKSGAGPDVSATDIAANTLTSVLGLRLHYVAQDWVRAGGDPFEATALLNLLSEQEPDGFIFRPYTRGITLSALPLPPMERDAAINRLSNYFYERYSQFEKRLKVMLDYIHQPGDHCRRAFIENYLNGLETAIPCGKCDHCAPSYALPWSDRIVEANIRHRPFDQQESRGDSAIVVLEAIRDHNGYFGPNTFAKMLLGEPFGQRRDGTKYALHPTARNSEHFGALKNYGIKEVRLRETIQRLIASGYLTQVVRSKRGQNPNVLTTEDSYQALSLTPLGRDALAGEASLDLALPS